MVSHAAVTWFAPVSDRGGTGPAFAEPGRPTCSSYAPVIDGQTSHGVGGVVSSGCPSKSRWDRYLWGVLLASTWRGSAGARTRPPDVIHHGTMPGRRHPRGLAVPGGSPHCLHAHGSVRYRREDRIVHGSMRVTPLCRDTEPHPCGGVISFYGYSGAPASEHHRACGAIWTEPQLHRSHLSLRQRPAVGPTPDGNPGCRRTAAAPDSP